MVVIIILLSKGKLLKKETFKSKKVFVLSYENNTDNINKKYLENKLKYYGYNYKFIGKGDEWKGFGTKIQACQKFIKNTHALNDDDILLILDSRDVYVNRPSNELIAVFEDLYKKRGGDLDKNLKLMFGSELGCCTSGITEQTKQKMKNIALKYKNLNDNANYFLNSGLCIGYVKAFRKIYLNFNIGLTEDDQTKITEFWINNSNNINKIILDYEQLIFSNAHFWGNENNLNGCPYKRNKYYNNQFVIKNTNICPFFIQTPAKYWVCYNYLYNLV
jgi:hypothetical protein